MGNGEYAVRINSKDGAVEVVGPDKDWVDAKLEQLQSVFAGYAADRGDGATADTGARKPTKRRKPSAGSRPDDDADAKASTPKKRAAGGRAEANPDLVTKLTSELKKKFEAYLADRKKAWDASLSAQAAIIATFLNDELAWEGVDQNDLYTIYNAMGIKIPRNMRSQLTNARQRDRYFSSMQSGKSILSHAGENFARHDSLAEKS